MEELNTQFTFLELSEKLEELYKQHYEGKTKSYMPIIVGKEFPRGNPDNYLQFFKAEELECLIFKMNPKITDVSKLKESEKATYLHYWADWIWIFYMKELDGRTWFFDKMRSISGKDLKEYEAGETDAKFFIYLANSFIRSINIYRQCKIPLTSLISDEYVSQYLFRGIRVDQFDMKYSMFPSNFQSYSMNTAGTEFVLQFYERQHANDKKKYSSDHDGRI